MKQLIVLVATLILGVSVGGTIIGFNGSGTELGKVYTNNVNAITNTISNAAITSHAE